MGEDWRRGKKRGEGNKERECSGVQRNIKASRREGQARTKRVSGGEKRQRAKKSRHRRRRPRQQPPIRFRSLFTPMIPSHNSGGGGRVGGKQPASVDPRRGIPSANIKEAPSPCTVGQLVHALQARETGAACAEGATSAPYTVQPAASGRCSVFLPSPLYLSSLDQLGPPQRDQQTNDASRATRAENWSADHCILHRTGEETAFLLFPSKVPALPHTACSLRWRRSVTGPIRLVRSGRRPHALRQCADSATSARPPASNAGRPPASQVASQPPPLRWPPPGGIPSSEWVRLPSPARAVRAGRDTRSSHPGTLQII